MDSDLLKSVVRRMIPKRWLGNWFQEASDEEGLMEMDFFERRLRTKEEEDNGEGRLALQLRDQDFSSE